MVPGFQLPRITNYGTESQYLTKSVLSMSPVIQMNQLMAACLQTKELIRFPDIFQAGEA